MNRNFIDQIAESKKRFHKKRAEMPFEEKVKIIVELQKIDVEMRKVNEKKQMDSIHKVWNI